MKSYFKYTLIALTTTLTACSEKDWTCTCTTASGGKSTYNINNAKKKLAKDRCKEYQSAGDNCTL